MAVSTKHPEYDDNLSKWRLTRDAVEGESAVKRIPSRYLPDFVPSDPVRYKKYVERAYFMGVTGRTLAALTGMVFRNEPDYEVPTALEEIVENADGSGNSLEQLAKEGAASIMQTGRHVYLADYPQADESLDAETERALGLRPVIASYDAESLINWRTETINGRAVLTLAVLSEMVESGEGDEFEHEMVEQFRVLRLREGVYTQQLYDQYEVPLSDEYAPRMAGGQTFSHIPLHIAGATNNKPDVDDPPLYDLAVLNIAHYRNTADLEEAGFITGQPTLHVDIGETSDESWKANNPNGVQIGSRSGIITQGGKLELVQAEERNLLSKLKEEKQAEMVAIGARLITRGGQAETAEAARINAGAEASTLDQVVSNLSDAIANALRDCALFMGVPEDGILYQINTDFWQSELDAQQLMALIQLGDVGILSRELQRDAIRKGRISIPDDVTDEDIDGQVANGLD